MKTLNKILEGINPYLEKVVLNPMSNAEIEIIQAKFKRKIPKYYIEFLQKIGLKQDLVKGLFDSVNQFEDINDYLSSDKYFRIGDNGGEDYWLLKFEDEENRTIYEFDYYQDFEIKSLGINFDELLLQGFENLKRRSNNSESNNLKEWRVQFILKTEDIESLVAEINKHLRINLIEIPKFISKNTSGVSCYEGSIEIENDRVVLYRSSFDGWPTSRYSFNWSESIVNMKNDSTIRKLDNILSQYKFEYKMIDYGIMDALNSQ